MLSGFRSSRPKGHTFWLVPCFIAFLLAGVAAARADEMVMAVKAPPASVYNWSGCYIGANVGGGTSGSNFFDTFDPLDGNGSANNIGFVAGGQVGCNWQHQTLVLGLEGDFDSFRSNPNFFNNTNGPPGVQQSLTTNYLATVRPRIGIAADRNFAYITGGVAVTNASYTDNNLTAPGIASVSQTLIGWTAGAGWEHAFADRWTFRVEYLIAGFPTITAVNPTVPFTGTADLTVQVLRAGVNFKF